MRTATGSHGGHPIFYDGAPRNQWEHDRLHGAWSEPCDSIVSYAVQDVFRRLDIDKIHLPKQEILAILEGTKSTPNDLRRCLRERCRRMAGQVENSVCSRYVNNFHAPMSRSSWEWPDLIDSRIVSVDADTSVEEACDVSPAMIPFHPHRWLTIGVGSIIWGFILSSC